MSASLVGSEMCIRDRDMHTWRQRGMAVWDSETRRHGRTETKMGMHEGSAVSYTHLTLPTICSV
eukprot:5873339-Alexandrium_andersonii.AAC.1